MSAEVGYMIALSNIQSRIPVRTCLRVSGVIGSTIALLLLAPATAISQTPKAKAKGGQVVNPAPVNYWMDVSTGASASGGGMGGMLGNMMGGMAARGAAGGAGRGAGGGAMSGLFGGSDNWFGAAQTPSAGRFTDIAIYDRRQPGRVTATQAIPAALRLGSSLPLLPPPPPAPQTKTERTPWDEQEPESTPQMPRFQIKLYWGCGGQVRAGQPRVLDFTRDNIAAWGQFMQGRAERDRGATSNRQSSYWPNASSNRKHGADGSLVGTHAITGAGLPASLAFQLEAAQDFMPALGLRTEGGKSGVINLTWSALPTATGYFANASGFAMREGQGDDSDEMTMVLWSAAEVPDPGGGLLGYLNNTNQERFLRERAILPSNQTNCQIPSGIFAQSMMVNIGAIAYGRELNLVYPARPSDPRTPWNQEWSARVRVKSQSSAMIMDGMGGRSSSSRGSMSSSPNSDPDARAATDAEARRRDCEAARSNGQSAGSDLGQAAGGGGGWRGALAGRALGALAGRAAGSRATNCEPAPPAKTKGN